MSKTVFHTVPKAFPATMEQTIFQKPLLLLLGELVWGTSPSFGTGVPLFSWQRKGWSLPPADLLGKHPSQAGQRTLHYHIQWYIFYNHVQWNIGSHIMDSICSSPSQGVLYSFPQSRVTIKRPEGLELIAPLFK